MEVKTMNEIKSKLYLLQQSMMSNIECLDKKERFVAKMVMKLYDPEEFIQLNTVKQLGIISALTLIGKMFEHQVMRSSWLKIIDTLCDIVEDISEENRKHIKRGTLK